MADQHIPASVVQKSKSCFYFLNRAESLHSPEDVSTLGKEAWEEVVRISETLLRCVRRLNQGQNNNCRELKGVMSWTVDYEERGSRHILIHNYISHVANSPAVFHYSYLSKPDSWTVTSVCHSHFNHHAFFIFFSFFFFCITPAAASQGRRGDFHKGFNHFGFLQWREGFTHRTRHRFIFVVDTAVRGDCRSISCLSEWVCGEDVKVFWLRDRGRVMIVLILGGRSLKLTDMSRLPHWADPNVENKGEKVYRTMRNMLISASFCLCTHTLKTHFFLGRFWYLRV